MTVGQRAHEADIGLLLEGTFPYVSGGVSTWVHRIIRAFPGYRFAVCFLGGRKADYGEMKYSLPENVVHLEAHYIQDPQSAPPIRAQQGNQEVLTQIARLHEYFRDRKSVGHASNAFQQLFRQLGGRDGFDLSQFLYSRAAWDYIVDQYQVNCPDPSFIDYFWTARSMHAPIWSLDSISRKFIRARAFHTISTGYAGFLGALLKHRTGCPLVVTEHGIYTKERKIDLLQCAWINGTQSFFQRDVATISHFRSMWTRFFEGLGRLCYDAADVVTALYEQNRLRQIDDGAEAAHTRNIPNGIRVERYAPLRQLSERAPPLVICLIGRVVPIKDIQTFIWAMRTVVNRLPQVQGWVVGPTDEDPEYAAECRNLTERLKLSEKVEFLGFQNVLDILPKVGLVVLSSISEALPLVILEAFAAGIPAVVTDVGACRQLIEGLSEEDAALGAAGRVVRIADPQALADAAIELLTDERRWRAAQRAAIARVETYYTEDRMFAAYREVYESVLG